MAAGTSHQRVTPEAPAEVASRGALGFICCTCAPASSVIVTLNANGAALMLIMQIKIKKPRCHEALLLLLPLERLPQAH